MKKLKEKEILEDIRMRIQYSLDRVDECINLPKKQRQSQTRDLVEFEINVILNIAFQNFQIFDYSRPSNSLPEHCISTKSGKAELITTKYEK